MQCTPRYLALCAIPKTMNRDGYAGYNAHIYVPFCGFIFASGAQYTFPSSTVAQDRSTYVGGVSMPDTFCKDSGVCC